MKIVFCWAEINAYMASCWKEFVNQPGTAAHIIAGHPGALRGNNKYGRHIADGLAATLLDHRGLMKDHRRVRRIVIDQKPDVVFIPGWNCSSFTSLAFSRELSACKFVMGLDTPRTDSLRQRLAWLKVGRLVRRMDMVVVPGERSWQFAVKLLHVAPEKLRRGLYGIDFAGLRQCLARRGQEVGGWPKKFIFVGRYVREKGFDDMIRAYRLYRKLSQDPWSLTCCGAGGLGDMVVGEEGIEDKGFVQPEGLPELLSQHGAFMLPSLYDPWPLAIVEAAAAGLPILCSDACGSAVEVVRPYYNGLTFPTGDIARMAHTLLWIQNHREELPVLGCRSQMLAEAYSAQEWARRWRHLMVELCGPTATS